MFTMSIQKAENAPCQDKKVLIRTDFHFYFRNGLTVPLEETRQVTELILQKGGIAVLGYHRNSPSDNPEALAAAYSSVIQRPVRFIPGSPDDPAASDYVKNLRPGEVALFPDLMANDFEKQKNSARKLASVFDIYINDAPAASLNPDFASISGLPSLIPSYAGMYLYRTTDTLKALQNAPERPFTVILGGVHLNKKIRLIRRFFTIPRLKVDQYLIGGGIAYTFLKSRAIPVGKSFVENALEVDAFQIIEKAQLNESGFLMPVDHVVAENYSDKKGKTVRQNDIPSRSIALDTGSKTVSSFEKAIKNSRTVLWYGPVGMTENPAFRSGSLSLAKSIASSKSFSAGIGEDTVRLIQEAGLSSRFDLLCPSSDAALEILHGNDLPGYSALVSTDD